MIKKPLFLILPSGLALALLLSLPSCSTNPAAPAPVTVILLVTPTPNPGIPPGFAGLWGQLGDYSGSPATGAGYFKDPAGVAVDSSGNVYVSDSNNHRVQKFTSSGTFVTMWGQFGNYSGSPAAGAGYFNYPQGIAVDGAGNVYVADTVNHRVQKFTSSGTPVTMWGQYGNYSGTPASGAGFLNQPYDLAVDGSGNVYVSDSNNHRVQKFTSSGTFVTMWGQFGNYSGSPSTGAGYFNNPYGVGVDGGGNVYVSDTSNNRVQKFTSSGTPVTMWGQFGNYLGSPSTGAGYLNFPIGIAVDPDGYVDVVDAGNGRIQKFTPAGAPTAMWGQYGDFSGSPATGAGSFNLPNYLSICPSGTFAGFVYVADTSNHRIQVFAP